MRRTASLFLPIFFLLLTVPACLRLGHSQLIRLSDMKKVTFPQLIESLRQKRVVFIGEVHDNTAHHQAELAVIRALHQAGSQVTIGLEILPRGDQGVLDAWVTQDLPEEQLAEVFSEDWGIWPLYRPIFEYARQTRLQMLALNISRQIPAQVAREGFDSLSPEQRQPLGHVYCREDRSYEGFIRRALGHHTLSQKSFKNFCEAQLVWDAAMTRRLREYLGRHAQGIVVVMAGAGHA